MTDSAAAFVYECASQNFALVARPRERVIEGYGFQDRFNVDLTNTSCTQKIPAVFDDFVHVARESDNFARVPDV